VLVKLCQELGHSFKKLLTLTVLAKIASLLHKNLLDSFAMWEARVKLGNPHGLGLLLLNTTA